jgi:hypothetical protein
MSAKKAENGVPAEALESYEKLVATNDKLDRKGATVPYTSVNGHMFSLIRKDGALGLRLPDEVRVAFLKKYKTKLFETYGAVMKEYVEVPATLLKNTKELQPYFTVSYEYVKSLKPKPTTRPRGAKSKK